MAQRVDLDGETDLQALVLAQFDQPVEEGLPISISGKVVVGDKEPSDVLSQILADYLLQIVRRPESAFASLDIDDRAERALIRAATSEVDGRDRPGVAPHMFLRTQRYRLIGQIGQVRHMIVERLQFALPSVDQDFIEARILGFAGEQADPQVLRFTQRHMHFIEHGDAARDVESANTHRITPRPELAPDIHRSGKLVALDPDQGDQRPSAGTLDVSHDTAWPDAAVGLVDDFDPDLGVFAEDLAGSAVLGDAIQAGQGVRRNRGPQPLNRIAIIVVVRRLDHYDIENVGLVGRHTQSSTSISYLVRGIITEETKRRNSYCRKTRIREKLRHRRLETGRGIVFRASAACATSNGRRYDRWPEVTRRLRPWAPEGYAGRHRQRRGGFPGCG